MFYPCKEFTSVAVRKKEGDPWGELGRADLWKAFGAPGFTSWSGVEWSGVRRSPFLDVLTGFPSRRGLFENNPFGKVPP